MVVFTTDRDGRRLGAAGVAIASATVRGVLDLPLTTLRSNLSLLRNPFDRHMAIPLTPEQVHYAFTNTLSAHVIPASANRSNVKKYRTSKAITAFKEFPGRSRFTLGQDGWDDVADDALVWAIENAPVPVTAARPVTVADPLAAAAH